jgi:YHS domain-containing protein
MKPEFVKCEFCKAEIPSESCKLAAYSTKVDGKEYTFCCVQCAERYEQKKKKSDTRIGKSAKGVV